MFTCNFSSYLYNAVMLRSILINLFVNSKTQCQLHISRGKGLVNLCDAIEPSNLMLINTWLIQCQHMNYKWHRKSHIEKKFEKEKLLACIPFLDKLHIPLNFCIFSYMTYVFGLFFTDTLICQLAISDNFQRIKSYIT